jgi:small subunit ribosomal protein S16
MLAIRLSKIGKKNAPSYRIVVANKRSGRNEGGVETLGYYNPLQKDKLKLEKSKMDKWIKMGAKTTQAVDKLLRGEYNFSKYAGSKSRTKSGA